MESHRASKKPFGGGMRRVASDALRTVAALALTSAALAQTAAPDFPAASGRSASLAGVPHESVSLPSSDSAKVHDVADVRFRTAGVIVASVGTTLAYGRAKWWGDGLSGGFKVRSEGWFGRNTDHGGADKLGHAMFAYTGTRLLTRAFDWAGNEGDKAVRLGLWTAVGTLMGVEVIDGFSAKWRFSREDVVANLAGGALGWWLETNPDADALVDLRIQYSPSTRPDGRREFDPFGDYSGQRYLLVLKGSGVPAWRGNPLARYLEFQFGYGTRNFEADTRPLIAPTRHVYYGVSLNLSEVLRGTVFRGLASRSRAQALSETFFEYVQVPAAAVQGDHVIR